MAAKRFVVASTSKLKAEAARAFFLERYPEEFTEDTVVEAVDAQPQTVPAQPFGFDQTSTAATERSKAAQKLLGEGNDYILVAIENGLVLEDDGDYYDIAVALVYHPIEGERYGISNKVQVPSDFYGAVRALLNDANPDPALDTVGKLIAKECDDCPHDRWQDFFGPLSRVDQMKQALTRTSIVGERKLKTFLRRMEKIEARVDVYVDWPKVGVVFYNVLPIFGEHDTHELATAYLKQAFETLVGGAIARGLGTKFAGLDARGFIIGGMLSCKCSQPFVAIRKQGKLPPQAGLNSASYTKEYGSGVESMEIEARTIDAGDHVVIVDDVLATGGTVCCAIGLIKGRGAVVDCVLVIAEVKKLKGRERVRAEYPTTQVFSLLQM